MSKVQKCVQLLCTVNLIVSIYVVFVTFAKLSDPTYKPICDMSERLNCSQVFLSDFGTGFGVVSKILGSDSIFSQPNGVYGILLYPAIILLTLLGGKFPGFLQLLLAACGFIVSTYGFINAFVFSPYVCVICYTGHTINYIIFGLTVLNYKSSSAVRSVTVKSSLTKRKVK